MYIDRCLARLLTPSERGQCYKAINLHEALTSDRMVTDLKRHRIFTVRFSWLYIPPGSPNMTNLFCVLLFCWLGVVDTELLAI